MLICYSCECKSVTGTIEPDSNGWYDIPVKICGKCFNEVTYTISKYDILGDREDGREEKTNEEN